MQFADKCLDDLKRVRPMRISAALAPLSVLTIHFNPVAPFWCL
jgi:hypothetical protein